MLPMSCCIFIAFVYDIILVLSLSVEFTDNSGRQPYGMSPSAAVLPTIGSAAQRKTGTLILGFRPR